MELPSNRVTWGRVLVLLAITVVAIAFGRFRWSDGSSTSTGGSASGSASGATAVGTVARTRGSANPDPTSPNTTSLDQAVQLLACLRTNESQNEYAVVSPSGEFFGAYQFDQQTWNNTAEHAGLTSLVGTQPNLASAAQQDEVALALLQWQGTWPWNGDPCVS
jgi:hypothetical protein